MAVWRGGGIVYANAWGTLAPSDPTPVDTDTVFQIGSDTKKWTALAVLHEVDAGRLSLEAPLAEVLPDFTLAADPAWTTAVTVHDLMTHQGALFDVYDLSEDAGDAGLADVAYGVYGTNAWRRGAPGQFWNYSNPNFAFAALAAEAVSGEAWADLVTDDLIAPLGLTRTFARKDEAIAAGNAAGGLGYEATDYDPYDPWNLATRWSSVEQPAADASDCGFCRPAGLLWSTPSDQVRLGAFLLHGNPEILSDERRADMLTAQTPLTPWLTFQSYGYGICVLDGVWLGDNFYNLRAYWHDGYTGAYTSQFVALPEYDVVVQILGGGSNLDLTDLTAAAVIGAAGLGETETLPDFGSESDHAEYLGTYVDAYIGDMIVTDVDGVLNLETPGLVAMGYSPRAALEFFGTDTYVWNMGGGYEVGIFFQRDAAGNVRWFGNRSFVGTRSD